MFNFKSLRCCSCNSVMFNLPALEIVKLNGMEFRCECCGHVNLVKNLKFKTSDKNYLKNAAMEGLFKFHQDENNYLMP